MLDLDPVRRTPEEPVVEHSRSGLLWDALSGAYQALGFDALADEVFASLVIARLIEPTSKADTIRILTEVGVLAPHENTLYNCLARCLERDYRSQIATACWAHASRSGPLMALSEAPQCCSPNFLRSPGQVSAGSCRW